MWTENAIRNQRMWKCRELNGTKNTTRKSAWNAAKVALRGKCVASHAHMREEEEGLKTSDVILSKRVRGKTKP